MVKKLYDELKLEQIYKEYEEKRVGEIRKLIAAVDESEGLKRTVFESFPGQDLQAQQVNCINFIFTSSHWTIDLRYLSRSGAYIQVLMLRLELLRL